MPTITNSDTGSVIVPMVRRYVQTKRLWSEPWLLSRYLEPVQARHSSAPQIGEADVAYDFGTIKREDQTTFVPYPNLSLNDRYVRLLIQREDSPPTPIWTGVFVDTQSTLISADVEGQQEFKAYELSHLLDRQQIRTSFVKPTMPAEDPADEDDRETVEINTVVVFNERTAGGALLGNRSPEKSEEDDAETWFFDYQSPVPWSNRDIIEYLLKRLAPPEITWELTGQTDPLDETFEIWDFNGGTSVWQALTELIKRERGLGFYLRVGAGQDASDADQTVEVVVYSISEKAYSYGAYELPPNDNQIFFALPGDSTGHLIGEIPFRNTATTQYDVIEVVGKRLLCAATWSVRDVNLDKGWTTEEETAYKLGISDDEEENDQLRSSDAFAAVYSRFVVERAWNGMNASGNGEPERITIPKPLKDGEYDTEERGEFWNAYKSFERDTPFLDGLDYTQNEIPTNNNDYELDYRPMLVAAKWRGYENNEEIRYAILDRLSDVDESLQNGHYRPLDADLGFEVKFTPRHFLAKTHWEDAMPSLYDPVLDWETLLVTAAVESDDPPKITLERQNGNTAEVEKKLRIDVPGCEYWYVNPKTVVDVDYLGERVIYLDGEADDNPELRWLRKDKDKLEAVASFAAAWYGPRRQAIQIPIKLLGFFVPLGSLLTDIRGVFGVEPVRTPITAKLWDFQRDLTLIETGYAELDYVGLMDDYFVTDEFYAQKAKAEAAKAAANAKRKKLAAGRIAREASIARDIGKQLSKDAMLGLLRRGGSRGPFQPGPPGK